MDDDDRPTQPMFVALSAVLAAIESGVIEEGEVSSHREKRDGGIEDLTITVRRVVQPLLRHIDPD